jgi:hypothetical protein
MDRVEDFGAPLRAERCVVRRDVHASLAPIAAVARRAAASRAAA